MNISRKPATGRRLKVAILATALRTSITTGATDTPLAAAADCHRRILDREVTGKLILDSINSLDRPVVDDDLGVGSAAEVVPSSFELPPEREVMLVPQNSTPSAWLSGRR